MLDTSARTLKILASVVWYGGCIILLFKSWALLAEAIDLRPGSAWPWGVVVIGVVLGGLKARYLFSGVCEKNLQRIQALEQPKIWQFFRKRFFLFLLVMIIIGVSLSRSAHHHYGFLLCIAALDLTIGVALMGSSYIFWKKRVG